MRDRDKKIAAYQGNQKKEAEKVQFPTLEELYNQQKQDKRRAAKYGFTKTKASNKQPARLHIDEQVINKVEIPPLRVTSPTQNIQNENGLIKFQQKGNGYRKAAKFLLLLSKDDAAEILKQFNTEEVELIAKELSNIKSVSKDEGSALLKEFQFLKTRETLPRGGIDSARNILVNAFGEKEGRAMLKKAVPVDPAHKPFEFLNEIEDNQLHHLLKHESDIVLATIIPFLTPEKGSYLIKELPGKMKISITRRIAKLQRLDPEIMNQVELSIREKIKKQGKVVTETKDGSEALANILKYMDVESEQQILDELEDHSLTLSRQVKEKIFTIDMIINIEDVDLQQFLRNYSDRELAIILKGKSDEVEHKILSNVSSNRALIIRQEKVFLGTMKRKEVDESTKLLLSSIRQKQISGEILVKMPGEDWV